MRALFIFRRNLRGLFPGESGLDYVGKIIQQLSSGVDINTVVRLSRIRSIPFFKLLDNIPFHSGDGSMFGNESVAVERLTMDNIGDVTFRGTNIEKGSARQKDVIDLARVHNSRKWFTHHDKMQVSGRERCP